MPKWEYLFITNFRKVIREESGRTYVLDGDKRRELIVNGHISDGDNREMWEVANQKGEEGWELVSAEQGYHWQLIFKRPKP